MVTRKRINLTMVLSAAVFALLDASSVMRTIPPRWVVTPSGIRIAPSVCQACHSRVLAEGTRVDGIPIVNDPGAVLARLRESLDITANSGDEDTARLRKQQLGQFGMPWLKGTTYTNVSRR
jgi:hypothetical protein